MGGKLKCLYASVRNGVQGMGMEQKLLNIARRLMKWKSL
jgi:hypothetical protein